MYLQYTSNRDKKYIREALNLKDYEDAKRKRWKPIGTGAFRKAYRKGNVVVKFAHNKRCRVHIREMRFYLSAPPHMRKYLARVFAVDKGKIIQRYVPYNRKKWTREQHDRAWDFIDMLSIEDAYPAKPGRKVAHNMAIYKGRPVLFDFNCEEPKTWKGFKRKNNGRRRL